MTLKVYILLESYGISQNEERLIVCVCVFYDYNEYFNSKEKKCNDKYNSFVL